MGIELPVEPRHIPQEQWAPPHASGSTGSRSEAVRSAVEHTAAALEVDVAAVVMDSEVAAAAGFADGLPAEELVGTAGRDRFDPELRLPAPVTVARAPIGDGESGDFLLAARSGGLDFSQQERDLLNDIARILDLSLGQIELIQRLREREELLARLSRLQRSISRQDDVADVLDATAAASAELLGEPFVSLCLVDEARPGRLRTVAGVGLGREAAGGAETIPGSDSPAGRAIREERVVEVGHGADEPDVRAELMPEEIHAAVAAPIMVAGTAVGAICVGSQTEGRDFSHQEIDALVALAETAGLAVSDARRVAEANRRALHDPLTGLPNRRLLADRVSRAAARARQSDARVAVLFCDIDGFKTINDSLGHEAGDDLLVSVAARLLGAVEPTDSVARLGGDEFAILIERVADSVEAGRVAQRILDAMSLPFTAGGREVMLSASIGIAVGTDEPEEMVRNADLAMYDAKGRGNGRYEIFHKEMHEAMSARLELEQDLKRAILLDQLRVHYQPIIDLDTGLVGAVEALVRWQHPERGLISPLRFIPLAEETGQIHEIGRFVMEHACETVSRWRETHPGLELNVNLSGVQLRQPGLVEEVKSILMHTGLDPQALVLEITESSLTDSTVANVDRLTALKALGVKVSIDDFGTGYSSLQYLRRFPVDILKIAKPFVDGVLQSTGERGLVKAIVDMAQSMELTVVGEGIESHDQAVELLCLGCPRGQGFYFSPPLTSPALSTVLAAGSSLVLRPALRPAVPAAGAEGDAAAPA